MIITIGKIPEIDPATGFPKITAPVIGKEVGNYIYYQDYCSEIAEKFGDSEVKLLSSGWVKLKDCRLEP